MFEKNMKIAYLFDFYGDALDDHIGKVMRAYYDEDLSLAEIAAEEGISRQGVRHLIKKGEDKLYFYEEKLGLAKRESELSLCCESLCEIAQKLKSFPEFKKDAEKISEITRIILKGNQDVSESD